MVHKERLDADSETINSCTEAFVDYVWTDFVGSKHAVQLRNA